MHACTYTLQLFIALRSTFKMTWNYLKSLLYSPVVLDHVLNHNSFGVDALMLEDMTLY